MRLDKYLSLSAVCSRKECAKAVRQGEVLVNGVCVKTASASVDPKTDIVMFCGTPVLYHDYFYLMLNKPCGVVSATDAKGETTVLDLLPERFHAKKMFPCGRLDKNTSGFVLMTNDGALAHHLLAPKTHVPKEYFFCVKYPLTAQEIEQLEQGIDIGEGIVTRPCRIHMQDAHQGIIILTEGKYHQIKRMMLAVHNQITSLSRISFAGIKLDSSLAPGEWRELTDDERHILYEYGKVSDKTET